MTGKKGELRNKLKSAKKRTARLERDVVENN